MKKRSTTGRKRVNTAKSKPEYNGITFDSSLEVYCYKQLEAKGLQFQYTPTTFILVLPLTFQGLSYEPDKKRGLLLSKKSPKLQSIKYTPDFVGTNWIIETKGRQNESFPLRWKLFKKYLNDKNIKYDLYLPKNQRQVDQCIELIQQNSHNENN